MNNRQAVCPEKGRAVDVWNGFGIEAGIFFSRFTFPDISRFRRALFRIAVSG
jgi:hypothetical protein